MHEGSLRKQISNESDDALKRSGDLNRADSVSLKSDDFVFPEGTNPHIKAGQQDAGLQEEVSSILQGLHEVSAQITEEKQRPAVEARKMAATKKVEDLRLAEEERDWEGAIQAAKAKIAAAETSQQASVKGVDLRGKIAATLKSEDAARTAAEEQRWLQAEETAKRKIALEAHANDEWEDAELQSRKVVADKKAKNQSAIGRLMVRLGLRKE